MNGDEPILIEVSAGELIDRITILAIRVERLADPVTQGRMRQSLAALESKRDHLVGRTADVDALVTELRQVNLGLWETEDALRRCEQAGDFGPRFVDLARSVYRDNDRRAALKARINARLGCTSEEKVYRL